MTAPDFAQLRLRALSLHHSFTRWRLTAAFTDDVQQWFLAYFRLEDAIHAADAVGYHGSRLQAWQQAASPAFDELASSRGMAPKADDVLAIPGRARHVLSEGDFLFHDVLWWARAFDDRVFTVASETWQTPCLMELLPHALRERITAPIDEIRPVLLDARRLGNFSLHGESVNQQAPIARRSAAGWVLPIPNRPTKVLPAYTNFNYTEGREATSYALALATTLRQFLGAVLDEIDVEERARATKPSGDLP